jgi:hypothetical protein
MSISPVRPLYQENFFNCPEDLAQDPKLRVKVNPSGIIWVPDKNHLR